MSEICIKTIICANNYCMKHLFMAMHLFVAMHLLSSRNICRFVGITQFRTAMLKYAIFLTIGPGLHNRLVH